MTKLCRWGKGGCGYENMSVTESGHTEADLECTGGLACVPNPSLCPHLLPQELHVGLFVFVQPLKRLNKYLLRAYFVPWGEHDGE